MLIIIRFFDNYCNDYFSIYLRSYFNIYIHYYDINDGIYSVKFDVLTVLFYADTYYNLFIRICILLDMLVDATVHQEDQATYLSKDVCVDYDGYKKETGDMYKDPHIYTSSNIPYCMILICDIQIVGSLVLY